MNILPPSTSAESSPQRQRHLAISFAAMPMLLCVLILHAPVVGAAPAWSPVQVDMWQPAFNDSRQRVPRQYNALDKAQEPWRICVSIPHLKDAYWLAVNHGLIEEARRLGVALSLYEAGGYEYPDVQRKQIERCLADKPHGLIISALSLDGINDLVARAQEMEIPVLDLINGMSSPHISARVAPSYWINAHETGLYLRRLQEKAGKPLRVAWFPGPQGAAWVRDADAGFRVAIKDAAVEIVSTRFGDTGRSAQGELIKAALDEHAGAIDYIIGTAPTAEAAVAILRQRARSRNRSRCWRFTFHPVFIAGCAVAKSLRRSVIARA